MIAIAKNAKTLASPSRLKFSAGGDNAKLQALQKRLGRTLYTFSLLSGHTCPYANNCLARVNTLDNGKRELWQAPFANVRCFSASMESRFPNVFDQRAANGSAILELAARDYRAAADLILASMPADCSLLRIHVGGDFATRPYFRAWCEALRKMPHVLAYAYTKSLPFWVLERDAGRLPENIVLSASVGGKADAWIAKHNLRWVDVVFSELEAQQRGLEIDHDDSHACLPELRNQNFALLIHGTQSAGSEAGKAVKALKGVGSYSMPAKATSKAKKAPKASKAKTAKAKAKRSKAQA